MRSKVANTSAYRTKKCKQFFENGFCPYGNRCQFAHALRSNVINNSKHKDELSYKKIIEILNDENNNNNNEMILFNKPRLAIFESIIKNVNNIPSTLKEDIKIMAKHAAHEANPLYPVPKLMNAKQLEQFYYDVMEEK